MQRVLAPTLIWILAAVSLPAADPTATILGTVTDSSGASVPNAKVIAANTETAYQREVTTAADGGYVLPLLPVGRYMLTVESPNFKKYVRDGIVLTVNQNARVDAALAVGTVMETVNIVADAAVVDTHSAALKEVVDPYRMSNLPLNGRDILQFQFLLPGVTPNPGETQALTGPFVPTSAAINGARAASNNYLLDGGSATDLSGGGLPAPYPHPDALQEFSILASSFSAEYGRQAGGTINAITKSGTNQLHGSLFEFLRNDKLNTRSFFSAERPAYKQNQFGFTLGGPVVIPGAVNGRDKLFFFTSYQGALVNDTHTLSAGLLNDFRASVTRFRNSEFPTSGQSYRDVGINAFLKEPHFVALSVSGWFNASIRRPSNEIGNTFQAADTMTWIRGRHLVKAGGEIIKEQFNSILDGATNPEIGFDGSLSRAALGDFLLGLPNVVRQSSGNEFAARRTFFSLFVQDDAVALQHPDQPGDFRARRDGGEHEPAPAAFPQLRLAFGKPLGSELDLSLHAVEPEQALLARLYHSGVLHVVEGH